jgi:hypothetical protein
MAPTPDGGPKWPASDYVVPQLSRAEMDELTPYKLNEARRAGKLARLLGVSPEHANRHPSALDHLLPKPGTQWTRADLDLANDRWQINRVNEARQRGDLADLMAGREPRNSNDSNERNDREDA